MPLSQLLVINSLLLQTQTIVEVFLEMKIILCTRILMLSCSKRELTNKRWCRNYEVHLSVMVKSVTGDRLNNIIRPYRFYNNENYFFVYYLLCTHFYYIITYMYLCQIRRLIRIDGKTDGHIHTYIAYLFHKAIWIFLLSYYLQSNRNG